MVVGAFILALLRPWWFTPLASNWGSIDGIILLSLVLTGLAYAGVNLFPACSLARYAKGPAQYIPDDPLLEPLPRSGREAGCHGHGPGLPR